MPRNLLNNDEFKTALENKLQEREDTQRLKALELLVLCERENVKGVREFIAKCGNYLNLNAGEIRRARDLSDPSDLEEYKAIAIEILQGDTLDEVARSSPSNCTLF